MADILLSTVAGSGGGGFQSEGSIYESLAIGQTGSLISLPEVSGKVYRITLLATSTNDNQLGISLITNGNTIESEKALVDSQSPNGGVVGAFGVVGYYYSVTDTTNVRKLYSMVECSSFEITKNAGNTGVAIDLVYEVGSYAS